MRVIVSAGGTGGHIYPALAIINKIKEKEPNSEFLYIGTHNRMEKDIVPQRGIPFKSIEMYGFNKKNMFKNLKTLRCLFKSFKACKKMIKEFNPDVVIGIGGYVTVPVIISAKKLGYKTFIHEQNSIPGKANRFLAKYCDLIGVSFKSSMDYLPKDKTVLTGNPCSEDAIKVPAVSKASLGLSEKKPLVLVTMGSLGSASVNKVMMEALKKFSLRPYEVLYISGKTLYEKIKNEKFPKNVKVLPFYEGLTGIMKKTDLCVSRAGASTLSEIIALELPTILIPSPYVANNHQYINAMDLIKNEAALMIDEQSLTSDLLVKMIDETLMDKEKLMTLKTKLKAFKVRDSATVIYDCLKDLIK